MFILKYFYYYWFLFLFHYCLFHLLFLGFGSVGRLFFWAI